MKKLAAIVLVSSALICAGSVPSYARDSHDERARAVEHRAGGEHRAFEAHRAAEHRGFERHEGHASFGWGVTYPYGGYATQPYAYAAPTPAYFCPTYGAYYPNVASCPVPWVAVTP